MKKLLMILVAFLCVSLCSTSLFAEPLTINEILEATCRVKTGVGMGSGTVVAKDDKYCYILTNAHVVGDFNTAKLEFFGGGDKTPSYNGEVVWRMHRSRTDVDFAVVAVQISAFSGKLPRIIPIAPAEYRIKEGQYISSAGCPAGRWAVGWEGNVLKHGGGKIYFEPAPIGGQSGSGIHALVPDKEGELHTRLAAILTWRVGDGSQAVGGAIPMRTLYQIMSGNVYQPIEVPENYKEVVKKEKMVCLHCKHTREEHPVGSDGKLYCFTVNAEGRKRVTGLPSGVSIVQWGCPPGGCPPDGRPPIGGWDRDKTPIPPDRGGGGRPPSGIPPIGSPWPQPGDGDSKEDKAKDKKIAELEKKKAELEKNNKALVDRVDKLNKQLEDLIKEKKRLESNLSRLQGSIDDFKKIRDSLVDQLEKAKDNLEKLEKQDGTSKAEIERKKEEIGRLETELKKSSDSIEQLKDNLKEKSGSLASIIEDIKKIRQENENLHTDAGELDNMKNQRDIVGGTGIIGVLLFGGTWLWRRFGRNAARQRIKERLDKIDIDVDLKSEHNDNTRVDIDLRASFDQLRADLIDRLKDIVDDKIADKNTPDKVEAETEVVPKPEVLPEPEVIKPEVLPMPEQPDFVEVPVPSVPEPEKDGPFDHPDMKQPPGVVQLPTYETVGYPAPPRPTGLGPVPPNYPVHQHSAHDVLVAVQQIADTHSESLPPQAIPVMVNQILDSPGRPRKP